STVVTVTPCSRRNASRLGARSPCATASASGRSASPRPRSRRKLSPPASSSGPSSGPRMSADNSVRRSRRFSRNSLAKTVRIARTASGVPAKFRILLIDVYSSCGVSEILWGALAGPPRHLVPRTDETYEGLLEAGCASTGSDLLRGAVLEHHAVRDHHHLIAE